MAFRFFSTARLLCATTVTVMLVSGCAASPLGVESKASQADTSSTVDTSIGPTFPSPQPPPVSAKATEPSGRPSLSRQFASWADALPGSVSVSVAAVGGNSAVTLAPERGGHVAWSTIKVPLALAAIRAGTSAMSSDVVAALTESDNSAAEALWSSLGPVDTAAGAVQAVLRDGGDSTTSVQAMRVRSGYTPFGQTMWSVHDQSIWAARLPCLADGDVALEPMRNVVSGQRWGFGAFPGAAIKGGWGPAESGAYLVRQFAVISHGSGDTAIAMTANPSAGTFAAGIDLLDQVAQWLIARVERLPAGSCS